MAQTTGALSFRAAVVKVSTTSLAYASMTDVSGSTAAVTVSGGERATGEAHTFTGDTPVLTAGKRGSIDVTVRYPYTEEAAEAFETVRAQYETAGGALYVMWAPKGSTPTSNFTFDTGAAIITSFKYPEGEAGDGAVAMAEFTVKAVSITKSTVAAS